MRQFWNSMSDAQATVIGAGLTIFAAIVGVVLGAALFGNRVRSLKDALEQTEKDVSDFKTSVNQQLADIEPQIAAVLTLVQKLRTTAQETEIPELAPITNEQAPATRENLKAVWHEIRDKIEEIASAPEIHGRTRAAFSRIARYSYDDIILQLQHRNLLGDHTEKFQEASKMWQNFQRRPENPNQIQFDRMQAIRDIVKNYYPNFEQQKAPPTLTGLIE